LDAVGEGVDGDDVGGGAAEKQEGDSISGRRCPSYGVGLAGGDLFVQAWAGDGVAGWVADLVGELEEMFLHIIMGERDVREWCRHWQEPSWQRRRTAVIQTLCSGYMKKSRLLN
jgi:hypothetical protein